MGDLVDAFRSPHVADETMMTLDSGVRSSMVEICTWSPMRSRVAEERDWEIYEPITLETGFDLFTTEG